MNWRCRQEIEDALWAAARSRLPEEALRRKRLLQAVTERTRIYTSERQRLGSLRSDPFDLAARALFFTVADAAKIGVPLAELAGRGCLELGRPLRVLDVGAGVGAMSLGLWSWLADRQESGTPIELAAVDVDRDALELFRAAATRLPDRPPLEMETRIADASSAWPGHGNFDLVLAGSVLNELGEAERVAVVRRLVGATAEHGSVIVIEPALRETSRALHGLRDAILEEGSAGVFAPCTRQGTPCPALAVESDWCHEERPASLPELAAQMANATGLRDGGLKFSYLVLRRDVRNVAADDRAWLRVVSRPKRSKGQREMFVCGDGGRAPLRLNKRNQSPDNKALARARRGSLVAVSRAPEGTARFDVCRDDRASVIDPALEGEQP